MQSAHKSLTVSQGGKPLYTLNNENVLQQPPASVIKQHINLHWERLEGHEALSYECDVLTDPHIHGLAASMVPDSGCKEIDISAAVHWRPLVRDLNTIAVTDALSRRLMCIVRCHWRIYSSFSICNSAVHRHRRMAPDDTSAKLNPARGWHSGKTGLAANVLFIVRY